MRMSKSMRKPACKYKNFNIIFPNAKQWVQFRLKL